MARTGADPAPQWLPYPARCAISCPGAACLRTLLIQGARSSLQHAKAVSVEKATPEQIWIRPLPHLKSPEHDAATHPLKAYPG